MNKKVFVIIVALIILSYNVSFAAEGDLWYKEGQLESYFMNLISKSVVVIENKTNGKQITGVLYSSPRHTSGVITNYHFMSSTSDTVSVYMDNSKNQLKEFKCKLVKYDKNIDLAFFSIILEDETTRKLMDECFINMTSSCSVDYLYQTLDMNTNLPIRDENFSNASNISRGKTIVFLGFPLAQGLKYDTKLVMTSSSTGYISYEPILKSPIARYGKIASENFSGNFIVDAMVSHGNSGSPVFIRAGNESGQNVNFSYEFVGILKGFIPDSIDFVNEENGQTLRLPHNSGLGIVISVNTIKDFLEKN